MATDLPHNLINSFISVFTITIIMILTPKLFAYFRHHKEEEKIHCQRIFFGSLLLNFLASGYIFLNSDLIINQTPLMT